MIKTIIKKVCVCDMCGYTYGLNDFKDGWDKDEIVPKEVFEFRVNLEDGPRTIQICPKCQVKLRRAFKRSLNERYDFGVSKSQAEVLTDVISKEEEEDD